MNILIYRYNAHVFLLIKSSSFTLVDKNNLVQQLRTQTGTYKALAHQYFPVSFYISKVYLNVSEKERDLIHWRTPLMPQAYRALSDQSQEPGIQSGSPTWWASSKYLKQYQLSPSICLSRSLNLGAVPGLKPRHVTWTEPTEELS